MKEKTIKDKMKDGGVHVLVTFEMLGKPADHVDKTLALFLAEVKKDERITIVEEHLGKAEKREDQYFSAYAEVDMVVKNIDTLTWLAVNYTPASIEIIEPDNFHLDALAVQNHFNDLLARLHSIGLSYKTKTSQLEYLKENFTKLIHNVIIIAVARSPRTLAQLAKETTLNEKLVQEQAAILVKEKRIVEKKGVYSLK